VTALALDWLDRLSVRKQPWFLFLNYIDPHAPYRPPVREREQFAPGIDPFSVAASTQLYNTGQLALTPQVKHAMSALYDGEVAAADAGLGELLEGLAARGYGDQNLLVVVTSDHGESLGDHGFVGHLLGMPESVLHVPLVLSGLGISPRVVSQPVQPVQLRATLRVILGLPPVPGIASALPPWGEALQLIVSEHRSPRWYVDGLGRWNRTFTTPTEWKTNWVAVERDGVKVVFDDQGQGVAYRLPEDPTESAPLPLTENTALVEAYRKRFRYAARADRSLFELSASDHERLRALGYIQ
jgi:arylsulfatase A-like enzyme